MLKGKEGCWVCGENHKASEKHSPQEVKNAINKMSKEHPKALFTAEDLAYISNELTEEKEEDETQDDDMFTSGDESDSVFYTRTGEDLVNHLADNAFFHGRNFQSNMNSQLDKMNHALQSKEEILNFRGIHLDTCANRTSIMSLAKYKYYCIEFDVPFRLQRGNKSITGVGGSLTAIGTAVIPIPFKDLNITIDVKFAIMKENIASLLLSLIHI